MTAVRDVARDLWSLVGGEPSTLEALTISPRSVARSPIANEPARRPTSV